MQSNQPDTQVSVSVLDEHAAAARRTWWDMLAQLYLWRRFVIGFTFTVAVLAVVISLLLPNWYRASTRLLLPESGSSGLLSAALGSLSSAATALLGGSDDYIRYLSILTSQGVYNTLIDEYDLIAVYELEEAKYPRMAAREALAENTDITIDKEYEFLSINVYDQDPPRAASIANRYVELLNVRNNELLAQSARSFREYAEQRYEESLADLDSVMLATKRFQQEYGIFDLEAQTEAFFSQLADLRVEALQAEIQYDVLLQQYGAGNPQVQAARQAVAAADRQYRQALAGAEQLMPVAQEDVPDAVLQYAELERERLIQARILETVAPILEQARFQEQRVVTALQVVDPATPPERKAKPRRSIIVIVATLSAAMLAVGFVLLLFWWKRQAPTFAARLEAALSRHQASS